VLPSNWPVAGFVLLRKEAEIVGARNGMVEESARIFDTALVGKAFSQPG
jgi:hypothetical protein